MIQPGERLLVAHGGKGGRGVVAPSRMQKQKDLSKEIKLAQVGHAAVEAGACQSLISSRVACLSCPSCASAQFAWRRSAAKLAALEGTVATVRLPTACVCAQNVSMSRRKLVLRCMPLRTPIGRMTLRVCRGSR